MITKPNTCPHTHCSLKTELFNPSYVVIGYFRKDDNDFEVIAAVNNYQFADDGQALRMLCAMMQAASASGKELIMLAREDLIDVISFTEQDTGTVARLPQDAVVALTFDSEGQTIDYRRLA